MTATPTPDPPIGGGWPVLAYWAKETLSPQGLRLWQTLHHKSACLSCAWGTGGQQGGFRNEEGEGLQRCMKSVEAIQSELQPGLAPHFFDTHSLQDLQTLNSQQADRLGRLSFPVILRPGARHYQRLSWPEVYDLVAEACRRPPQRVASYSSGRSSNEAAYLLQLFLRLLGSNHLADCSDLCHVPSTVGLKAMFGSGTSMVSLESLQQTDCVVLVGSNAPANHPRLMNELIKLRSRGGSVIVINPLREGGLVKFASPAYPLTSLAQGSPIASQYLQPIPGSDVAVFVGIQKALIAQGAIDRPFLAEHTHQWEEILAQAQATPWEAITHTCGLPQAELEAAAHTLAAAPRVVFAWAMGITQHRNGVENVYAIGNTALLLGKVGKPGCGTMPIRGHSNVQGFGSMGVTPQLREEMRAALEQRLGRSLTRAPGYRTRDLVAAALGGEIDTLLCLGGNLYGANPNSPEMKAALGQVETIVYLATKPNPGHFHGLAQGNTLILPVLNRFENPHLTTTESGNNFVRFNSPGQTHLQGADVVAEVDFLAQLAHRVLGSDPVDWLQLQDTHYIRQWIADTVPGYSAIAPQPQGNSQHKSPANSQANFQGESQPNSQGQSPDHSQPQPQEFTIEGHIFNEPKFPTPDGKATLFPTPLPQLSLPDLEAFGLPPETPGIVLALMTGRSYGQHNTVVYQQGDRYRNMPHRHCILVNPDDALSQGWQEHQRVTVRGNVGQMEEVELIFGAVRSGAALMFYPECNGLFAVEEDPRSGIPAYKRVPIAIFSPKMTEMLPQSF